MPGETPMDSGAPVPYRVPFEKTNWDEEWRFSRCLSITNCEYEHTVYSKSYTLYTVHHVMTNDMEHLTAGAEGKPLLHCRSGLPATLQLNMERYSLRHLQVSRHCWCRRQGAL